MMKRRIILYRISAIIFCLTFTCQLTAQSVSYTYKALAAEGCNMKYNVVKKDASYYIIATVRSDRMYFLNEPTMKIRTFSDEVLAFNGDVINNSSKTLGVVSGNIVIPSTSIISTAQFPVTIEQFEKIKNGVSKIRLSMTPMNHERTFKKDKIGKKLYKLFLKVKSQDEEF